MDDKQIGIINEIGDLGLGFDPINEEDKEKIKEQIDE
jgi:hypothetical protein